MFKKLLLALLAVPVLIVGGRTVARALASDATLVRWTVEGMERGYAKNRVDPVIGPIAPEWRHADGSGADRGLLADALRQRFFVERHPETRERLDRVAIDWDTWSVEVLGDGAAARFELEVEELRPAGWERTARARFEVEFERGPEGWRLVRSSHEPLVGELY
jgi:hypothetical protein